MHSCGTVYPHDARELAQPDRGLDLAGTKSYGRATSFLALTGFEQTGSIVAEPVGDHEAAAWVELVLLTLRPGPFRPGRRAPARGRRARSPRP